jgi:hypothetical protein
MSISRETLGRMCESGEPFEVALSWALRLATEAQAGAIMAALPDVAAKWGIDTPPLRHACEGCKDAVRVPMGFHCGFNGEPMDALSHKSCYMPLIPPLRPVTETPVQVNEVAP